jgi:Putative beta-barrel porin-2, OmpL-like. bbp2
MSLTPRVVIAAIVLGGTMSALAQAQEISGPQREPAVGATVAPVEADQNKAAPFAFADFTWLTGNPRTKDAPLDSKAFTGEFRVDTNYTFSFNHPQDDTISGSSEVFRSGEVQVTQLGIGGDFHYENVRGRLMIQFGLYSQTTARNDASPARGQWNLDGAYRYISEAYGGYHWGTLHGINVDAGIFMSYIGLDSWAARFCGAPTATSRFSPTTTGAKTRSAIPIALGCTPTTVFK